MAAPPAVAAPVGVSRRGLAVFGPPAEDLIGAVVAAAAGHARRGLVDLEPWTVQRGRRREKGAPDAGVGAFHRQDTHCNASLKNW